MSAPSSLQRAVADLAAAPGASTLAYGSPQRLRDLLREMAHATPPIAVMAFARGPDTVAADLGVGADKLGIVAPPLPGAHERPPAELDDLLARVMTVPGTLVVETLATVASLYGAATAERLARAVCGWARESRRSVVLFAPKGHGPLDTVLPGVEYLVDRVIDVG